MERWQAYIREAQQQLYELLVYGNLRQRKCSFSTFKQEVLSSADFRPVFFLSTGRTGTQLFTQLLNQCPSLRVFHAPKPELIQQGKIVYEAYQQADDSIAPINRLAGQLFLAAREDLLHACYLHQKTYVETNNRITFFAMAIRAVIPNARFVHLYRHPGDFIRSGIRRQWYAGSSPHDIGRITGDASPAVRERWQEWDQVQKNAWLWNETNEFIEDFLSVLEPSSYFKLDFNALTERSVQSLLHFIGCDLSEKKIRQAIRNPVNQQRDGDYPLYAAWPEADKEKVRALCPLAQEYDYRL